MSDKNCAHERPYEICELFERCTQLEAELAEARNSITEEQARAIAKRVLPLYVHKKKHSKEHWIKTIMELAQQAATGGKGGEG